VKIIETKRAYRAPLLVRYGEVGQLTLGNGGTKPDFPANPAPNCNASQTAVWGCLTQVS
jgi:hypothetical protein